jgi:hypothetical protein
MLKALAALLSLLDRLTLIWRDWQSRQQGRQETFREMNDAINRQIELGEAAITVPDPDRDKRLRNRFDRSAAGDQ